MDETRAEETRALLDRLPGTLAFDLTLRDAEMLTRSIRRLHFTSKRLEHLPAFAGQDLMLSIPRDGGVPVRRRYTMRHLSPMTRSVDLDVVLHGDGPGARWATGMSPGDRVGAVGPRGKIGIAPDVDWHLFSGDLSALPAICEMIEALPSSARATALFAVTGPQDQMEPEDAQCEVDIHWLRCESAVDSSTTIATTLRSLLSDGPGHAYVFGELHQVAAVCATLVTAGLSPSAISQKAYWRLGSANAPHGEPERSETS